MSSCSRRATASAVASSRSPSTTERPVQLGGELVGRAHTAYLGLVEELGLTLDSTYTVGRRARRRTTSSTASTARRTAFRSRRPRSVPTTSASSGSSASSSPPSIPTIRGRIRTHLVSTTSSWAGWLRSVDALPTTVRAVEAGALALAAGSSERTSLLSELRKAAAVGDDGFYSYDLWESLQVAEGSAEVALRMAAELDGRIRLGAVGEGDLGVLEPRPRSPRRRRGDLVGGGRLRAAGQRPPRDRDRRNRAGAARFASRAAAGAGGEGGHGLRPLDLGGARRERSLGRRAAPRVDVAAARGRPLGPRAARADRLAHCDRGGAPPGGAVRGARAHVRARGRAARVHSFLRLWATDPFTHGYTTHWWPGDVLRVGPLHGTHDPPFYVCGSDQWVAGYMEGAVRTGRAAAAAALRSEAWAPA